MLVRNQKRPPSRGVTAVECAIVYPITMLLLIGVIVAGLGVFRYEQLQSLAREGARYASVHGPDFANETGGSQATTQSVLTYVQGLAVGLSGLNCTEVAYSASSLPCTVTVTLTYTWTPEAFFLPMTWTISSTMPITY